MPNKPLHTNQFKHTEMLNIVGYVSFNNWTCEHNICVSDVYLCICVSIRVIYILVNIVNRMKRPPL